MATIKFSIILGRSATSGFSVDSNSITFLCKVGPGQCHFMIFSSSPQPNMQYASAGADLLTTCTLSFIQPPVSNILHLYCSYRNCRHTLYLTLYSIRAQVNREGIFTQRSFIRTHLALINFELPNLIFTVPRWLSGSIYLRSQP
jgi:hypothetical protein